MQDKLEAALSRVANHPLRVVAAGRTDTGVHGLGQIVHFEGPKIRSEKAWYRGGNTALPDGISITWVRPVCFDFHARFAAKRRSYRYILLNRPVKPALFRDHVSWEFRPLALEPMRNAANMLLGRHDFSAFRASSCQSKLPTRTLHHISLEQHGDWFCLDVEADGFLHHMVRNIAGVLIKIGKGERDPDWCAEVLQSRDRRQGGMTAPPQGLYLTRIEYDPEFELPDPNPAPIFW